MNVGVESRIPAKPSAGCELITMKEWVRGYALKDKIETGRRYRADLGVECGNP
jgi:hypothetical protein